ncbi:peptidase M20 [Gemmatirosa kalamazoonensis]|uniref:Peptidase M20 n=1 Tax=Gemmatirosa kalamazoonensis TaxID=861299 RepID=W0RGN1_9BACT|nr:M20/M25/M40 family metallo-hydrolase [Gemmatirosa kalamazoonensis]AHG89592.1 peptidase M20 [Gemmatirosa kalamazoonensis]
MRPSPITIASAALALLLARPAHAQGAALSSAERALRAAVRADTADQIAFLAKATDIQSATMNFDGVRRVGALFRAALDSLGFTTRWIDMSETKRAGHLVAEHKGKPGAARILLIGHLDTVVEGDSLHWSRADTVGRGAGVGDMKGGDVILLYALKAMKRAGTLKDANVTVVMTGDEESAGSPLAISRRDLIDAAKRSDVALAFEGGNERYATVARRGASTWMLTVHGRQSHSAGIFGQGAGYGAVFEAARILDAFRRELAGEQYLTFNPALIVGGTDVTIDTMHVSGTAGTKTNIVAPNVTVIGDLRFLTEEQKAKARERMKAIATTDNLPGTSAEFVYEDEYPAQAPSAGNQRLLAAYDSASRALGYGAVEALDPGRRGAGDASFVAPVVDAMDGLGALGNGAHTPRETVSIPWLAIQTERAALLIQRLSRQMPVRKETATF